ncbi:dihydrolipoyl dehydrogenase [Candidatus Bathyarchaeota archaeon]|nr:dihydrolipoyl dehydrogenase [Candidatus Bathyarchaeota archaeon]MBS7630806.1 dihydrolipoyl dehydrogenase [Candidatus Bathyarchaeota archaeon]
METFDVLVIGSGSGMHIVENALMEDMTVALVEMGPLGGTCLNRGCIPSKMIIYPMDVVQMIRGAEKLGIKARIDSIDFKFIMRRMRELIENDRHQIEEGVENTPNLKLFRGRGEFVSDYTLSVSSGDLVKAENIFIVSGARTLIPPIKGLDKIEYLTSENIWNMEEPPKSMVIVGGGFVGVEFAHFFSTMGAEVTLISKSPKLVKDAEPEISDLLLKLMRRSMKVETGLEAVEVERKNNLINIKAIDTINGSVKTFSAEALFIASGRKPNSDIIRPEKTGVETNEKGFVIVDDYFRTSKERIWSFGDVIGKAMFKHVANYEAEIVWNNFIGRKMLKVDYDKIPYAVYSYPQIASVGLTEKKAKERGYKFLVGEYYYKDTARGAAMAVEDGFVKVLIDENTRKLLGCHIIGPYAPEIIQEAITVMNCEGGTYFPIVRSMHIHPCMSEVLQFAFTNLHRHEH